MYRGDGLNLYAYCGNNPVMYVDPSGYSEQCGTGSENGTGSSNSEPYSLYRKMCEAEYEKTIKSKQLHGQIPGKDSSKWVSESYEKVNEFNNQAVVPGTKEYVVEFQMTDSYKDYFGEAAIPQKGSKGKDNVK